MRERSYWEQKRKICDAQGEETVYGRETCKKGSIGDKCGRAMSSKEKRGFTGEKCVRFRGWATTGALLSVEVTT